MDYGFKSEPTKKDLEIQEKNESREKNETRDSVEKTRESVEDEREDEGSDKEEFVAGMEWGVDADEISSGDEAEPKSAKKKSAEKKTSSGGKQVVKGDEGVMAGAVNDLPSNLDVLDDD